MTGIAHLTIADCSSTMRFGLSYGSLLPKIHLWGLNNTIVPMSEAPTDVTPYELFIGGRFQGSTEDKRIEVEYPYTGEAWSSVPNGSSADIDAAVKAARDAFERTWQTMLPGRRRELLYQIADVVDEYATELAELETRQTGKLISEMEPQMKGMSEWYRYYGGLCETTEGRTLPNNTKDGQMFTYTRKEPLGVVGAITPWNSPLKLMTMKLAPALAAGNAFVHKPSEQAPVSALRFAELLYTHTDLPEGVYNVVPGDDDTGRALTDHADVDKLAFTGSTQVGRQIAKKAGENLVPVMLELGGKSPNIVFPTADLEAASNGVAGGIFAATGQTCVAGSRVFVHEDIYEDFLDRFTDRAANIQLGDPMDHETEMGPLAFEGQLEKVETYIDLGVEEGASIAFGGSSPDEIPGKCLIQPTILVDTENQMRVAQEEIFGPVACVIAFSSENEVLQMANDTKYGLAAGVWTEDMKQAHRMAAKLEAGTVWINEYRKLGYSAPFGGYKDSGLGRENGQEGFEEFLQTKSVWVDLSGVVENPFETE